jgi:predicted secreted acid phosphatase
MSLKTCFRLITVSCSLALTLASFLAARLPAEAKPSDSYSVPKVQPSDLPLSAGVKFTDTPAYQQEMDDALNAARKFCTDYQSKHEDEKNVAVVFDIDETLLDNRPFLRNQTEIKPKEFFDWVAKGEDPPLESVASFAEWARANGFAVFLITARYEELRLPTIINLVKAGIAYDGLYMCPTGYHGLAETVKTGHRKAIEDMGFKIVENVGDQDSDLVGGYSLDCEKLPNKMYFVP